MHRLWSEVNFSFFIKKKTIREMITREKIRMYIPYYIRRGDKSVISEIN